jgi:hypothetical protein
MPLSRCKMSSQNKFWQRKTAGEASHGQSLDDQPALFPDAGTTGDSEPLKRNIRIMSCTFARLYILSAVLTGKCLANKFWRELVVEQPLAVQSDSITLYQSHTPKLDHVDFDYSDYPTQIEHTSVSAALVPAASN